MGDFLQVIVATSLTKSGSTVYGNIAATVVLQVDPTVPYGPDPGHPGFGTVVAVLDDGAGLVSRTAVRQATPAATADASVASTASTAPGKVAVVNPYYGVGPLRPVEVEPLGGFSNDPIEDVSDSICEP